MPKLPNKADMGDKHEAVVVKRGGKGGHDEGHGGAWKVAFADFCLALMCLFLVLWLMAARKQENIQMAMRAPGGDVADEGSAHPPEVESGMRGSLIDRVALPRMGAEQTGESKGSQTGGAQGAQGAQAAQMAASSPSKVSYESASDLQALAQVLEKQTADVGLASNLQTVISAYGLRVMLHDTDQQGMFVRGSALPTDRFRHLLLNLGPVFARMDNQMLIVGHTDATQYANRAFGAYSNWTLSSDRAMMSRALLLSGGMSAHSVLQVVGMADRAPMDSKDVDAAVNRRIELVILTHKQASAVAAMFGQPSDLQPFTADADAALPGRDALNALRAQLIHHQGGGAATD